MDSRREHRQWRSGFLRLNYRRRRLPFPRAESGGGSRRI
nr:MAG TPA: hypothetical protein [Bacteriophage sp.]